MFNRIFLLLAGLAMTASATGCCCLGGCFANKCCPSPCGPGGCSPSYGYPPASTSFYQGDSSAMATAIPAATITTVPTYTTTTALMPALPTY